MEDVVGVLQILWGIISLLMFGAHCFNTLNDRKSFLFVTVLGTDFASLGLFLSTSCCFDNSYPRVYSRTFTLFV